MSREPTNYTRTRGPEERNLQEMQFTHLCCQMSGCKDKRATENTHNETKTQKVELRVRNSAPGSTEEGSGRDLREERAKATSEMEVGGHETGRPAGMCGGPHFPPEAAKPHTEPHAAHRAACYGAGFQGERAHPQNTTRPGVFGAPSSRALNVEIKSHPSAKSEAAMGGDKDNKYLVNNEPSSRLSDRQLLSAQNTSMLLPRT